MHPPPRLKRRRHDFPRGQRHEAANSFAGSTAARPAQGAQSTVSNSRYKLLHRVRTAWAGCQNRTQSGTLSRAPRLHKLLAPEAMIFVNDSNRREERKMQRRWQRELLDFTLRDISDKKGAALLERAA